MLMNKRALALWLGLFFYILVPLGAQSDHEQSDWVSLKLTGSYGTLWVEDDGAAIYWQSGLDLTLLQRFKFNFDIGEVKSDLPWAEFSAFGYLFQCGLDTPNGGFNLTIGKFNHSFAKIIVDDIPIYNDEGQGHFINIISPIRSEYLSITPYLFFGEASWSDGSMYAFFGKPKIPSLIIYGLNLNMDLKDWFKHSFSYYSLATYIKILSNNDIPLFNIGIDAGFFMYQFILDRININFTGTLGWFFSDAFLDGALTSSNQPYIFFPFLFYNVDASFKTQAGFAAFGLRHKIGIFQYSVDLGVLNIFDGGVTIETNYRRKRLFGGGDFFEESSLDLKGLGAAFLVLDAGLPALPITKCIKISLGIQKIFIIPWGYEKLFADEYSVNEPSVLSEIDISSIIRSILSSGISIRGSISY